MTSSPNGSEFSAGVPPVRTVAVTRYVTPLREGGSLPAIVEADDLGTYVLKFRGAGQGPKVLVAELIAGELGRLLGLPVPEIVFAELDPVIGRSEPDPEIRDVVMKSGGLNLAIDFLPGSFAFDPAASPRPDPDLAAEIVWFDALITNVDRTVRNTNMLLWHRRLYLIDHGAALYIHYSWPGTTKEIRERTARPFPQIRDHVLLPFAGDIAAADARLAPRLTDDVLTGIVGLAPDTWLEEDATYPSVEEQRRAYFEYLRARLQPPREFVREAIGARAGLV